MGASSTAHRQTSRALSGLLAAWLSGCIIPDSDIRVQVERTNPGAVRLVQPVGFSKEALNACTDNFGECPTPPGTLPFGLIDTADRPFCICPSNQRDLNALYEFDILVEDPDVDPRDDRSPLDSIFGALLLDPQDGVSAAAYENYLPTSQPARPAQGSRAYDDSSERPPPNLKEWTLGAETRVDLCNNNNGAPVARPGVHTLLVVVTDRPWYVPVREKDSESEFIIPELSRSGFVRDGTEDPIPGIPDIPGGASYDTAAYVFVCLDAASSDLCNCSQPT